MPKKRPLHELYILFTDSIFQNEKIAIAQESLQNKYPEIV
jgi:hypothetical protein